MIPSRSEWWGRSDCPGEVLTVHVPALPDLTPWNWSRRSGQGQVTSKAIKEKGRPFKNAP